MTFEDDFELSENDLQEIEIELEEDKKDFF